MRKEEDIREFEGLVDISVAHEFLVGESFVGFVFLELGVYFGGVEAYGSGNGLRDDTLVVFYEVVDGCGSLQRRYDHVSHRITILETNHLRTLLHNLLSHLLYRSLRHLFIYIHLLGFFLHHLINHLHFFGFLFHQPDIRVDPVFILLFHHFHVPQDSTHIDLDYDSITVKITADIIRDHV